MGDDAFDENLLTEKLSNLNSSQQSIESFSRWCISHRKKARIVVERWDAQFKSSSREKRVSLLYLCNDILQNSRRKGSEFVNEFWKVLPPLLKKLFSSSDDASKKVASRLVDIWEERKVFGSKGLNLRNELFGGDSAPGKNSSTAKDLATGKAPSPAESSMVSNPVKIVKRDANFLRTKLAVGVFPERIVTAFHQFHDEISNEEKSLNECRHAVSSVRELEKDAVNAAAQGSQLGPEVMDDLHKQENVLRQSISQLEKIETARAALFSQLRDAVLEQESKLELIRSELHVARRQLELVANTQLQLTSTTSRPPPMAAAQAAQASAAYLLPSLLTNHLNHHPSIQHPTAPAVAINNDEEGKRAAAAAAVAAKLAASASSAQMLTSVLSSLVAEEAGLKRAKLEKPMMPSSFSSSDPKISEGGTNPPHHFPSPPLPPPPMLNQLQPPFVSNAPANQMIGGGVPYGYAQPQPQPPLLSSEVAATGYSRPPPQQGQSQQQLQIPGGSGGGYYRGVGVGFYGQSHQPATTPPIHRQ